MPQYIVYAIPETRPGRTTRPVVVLRVGKSLNTAWDSINCEAIEPSAVTATGTADARRVWRAAFPGADQRRPGGI